MTLLGNAYCSNYTARGYVDACAGDYQTDQKKVESFLIESSDRKFRNGRLRVREVGTHHHPLNVGAERLTAQQRLGNPGMNHPRTRKHRCFAFFAPYYL